MSQPQQIPPRSLSVSSASTSSTPSASPVDTTTRDRLSAFLGMFEAGTHAFWRDASEQETRPQPAAQPAAPKPLLSLLKGRELRHFDPCREPKLHGLP